MWDIGVPVLKLDFEKYNISETPPFSKPVTIEMNYIDEDNNGRLDNSNYVKEKNIVINLVLLTLLVFVNIGFASNGNTALFLSVPVGARPVSMGGAYTAVAYDINSLYWNPAGLCFTNGKK